MSSLDSLLLDASSIIQSEFKLKIEKSVLKPYSHKNWQEFCQINDFDAKSSGIYIPMSYSAYVRTDSPFLIANIFHELYGHGLFVEHSKIGKKLVEIIKNNGDEKGFMFNEVNPKEQVFGIARYNIQNYEGFAIWLEALLCKETNNAKIWNSKKDGLRKEYTQLFEFFEDAERKLTRFGFIAQMGFPKYYTSNDVLNVVKKLYDSYFNNIDLVVLYGSQKPESDIDLFIVSNNSSKNYFNGWLDIYELNRREFNQLLNKLDISVTDPLFSGKLVYGDSNFFEKLKQKIINLPITREAINHNLKEAEKQREYLKYIDNTNKRKRDCLSYIDSFSKNAEQLILGNKPLTLKNLKQIYAK